MKYRVMASDGTIEDFETEQEARALFEKKKKVSLTDRIFGREKLSCSIHRCYHDEGKSCANQTIERFEK